MTRLDISQTDFFDGDEFTDPQAGQPVPWLSDDDMSEDQLRDALGGSWAVEGVTQ